MGNLVFQATLGGQVNLVGPNTASTFNINVPATAGTMVTTGDTGTVTNTMLASSAYTAPGTIGSGTPNTGAFTTLSATGNVTLGDATTDTLNVGAGGLVKDASGNVGIGTSSPVGKLQLSQTNSTTIKGGTYVSLGKAENGVGGYHLIGMGYNQASEYAPTYAGYIETSNSGGTAGDLVWFTRPTGQADSVAPTERLRLDSSGNLGLGVTPSAWGSAVKIFEAGAVGNAITGWGASDVSIGCGAYYNGSNWKYAATNSFGVSQYELYNGAHYWAGAAPTSHTAGDTATLSTRMVLDASGNLGVGTTSPGNLLHLYKSSGGAYAITENSSGKAAFGVGSGGEVTISAESASNIIRFLNNSGATERARINSSGVLCVGTTGLSNNGTAASFYGSGSVIRVYGTTESTGPLIVDKSSATTTTAQTFINFTINNQGTGSGQINANGSSQAAFGSFSDERLKENIVDIPPQLANIMALRPVEFDYKAGGHQTGFIAQEMQQVFPDAVGEDGSENNYLTVTGWNKTEAILVKAIQEQQTLITALTARITALEA